MSGGNKRSFETLSATPMMADSIPLMQEGREFGTPPKRCRPIEAPPASPFTFSSSSSSPFSPSASSSSSSSSNPFQFDVPHFSFGAQPSSFPPQHVHHHPQRAGSPPRKIPFRSSLPHQSPFQPSSAFDTDSLARLVPASKKFRHQARGGDEKFQLPQQPKESREIVFTLEQVKEIVKRAVEERDQALTERYDQILKEKLGEQFENFSRFNQDYISRQMRDSQWDYMS